jgi:hypothetical protein
MQRSQVAESSEGMGINTNKYGEKHGPIRGHSMEETEESSKNLSISHIPEDVWNTKKRRYWKEEEFSSYRPRVLS